MSYIRTIANIASLIIGTALLVSGIWGVIDSLWFARNAFGVPTATKENVAFYPGLAGRNTAQGLAIWILTLAGQRRSVGVILLTLLCNGLADVKIIYDHPGGGETGGHYTNMVIVTIVGSLMLMA